MSTIISMALLGLLNFHQISISKQPTPALRMAKLHYVLNQQWLVPNVEIKKEKVCEGDIEIPVFSELDDNQTIPIPALSIIRCKTMTKTLNQINTPEIEVTKQIATWVQYDTKDYFGNQIATKKFTTLMSTDGGMIHAQSHGNTATQDPNLKSVDFSVVEHQAVFFDGIEGGDDSTYILNLRIVDEGPAPNLCN